VATRDVDLPWAAGIVAFVGLLALAFWPSYEALLPVATSDSPDAVVIAVPAAALALIVFELRRVRRHGDELAVNLALALPLLAALALLLVILPAKLSYAYWLFRFDLLAVPVFAAAIILILFGFPALYASRRGLVLLVVGWPPLVDGVVRATADPLASLQSRLVGAAVSPLGVGRVGASFVLPDGHVLVVGSACAGLAAVFGALGVGGAVMLAASGSRRRRCAWLAFAVAIALVGNVVRLAIVVAAGRFFGFGSAFGLLHGGAGAVVFGLALGAALLALPRFGLRLAVAPGLRGDPLRFRGRGPIVSLAILGSLALLTLATTAGGATPGLFLGGVPRLSDGQLLRLPAGWRVDGSDDVPYLAASFGAGARARVVHLAASGSNGVAAQVIVTPSYRDALHYGVLNCFSFHRYTIRATRYVKLGRDGTATLVALSADGRNISSASWIQPALLNGHRVWRRVVLFAYAARGAAGRQVAAGSDSVGTWLLNHLSPYGGTKTPAEFAATERQLLQLASESART
jgi:exosortase